MSATLVGMSKQKPKPARASGKHKLPRRMVGLPEPIAAALEQIGERRMTNVTEMVKLACIEYLTREGAWPPPAPK
jgi:hypothetical protein